MMLAIDPTDEQNKRDAIALSKLEFEKARLLLINQMVDVLLEQGTFPRTREGVDNAREEAIKRLQIKS